MPHDASAGSGFRPFQDRAAGWLVRHRAWLAAVGVVLAIASVERSRHLEFSRSIESMFDSSDASLGPYRVLKRAFGSSEVVLAAYEDPGLFSDTGLERLEEVTGRLAKLPGVKSATSLVSTPLGRRIADDSAASRTLVSLMEGYVVGKDRRTAGVVCVLGDTARADAVDAIRGVVRELPRGTVAGEPAMLRDGFAMLERDGRVLGLASALLSGGVILACFRSLRWLVVPMVVVLLALWSTRGILAVAGLKLTMVSAMLSAMITVVGIATVVHLIVEFRRQRDSGLSPEAAIERAIAVLLWPTVGAIVTDCIGFGSLLASRVGPVHDFGLMTAIGAVMVLVAAGLVVPFLAVAGRFDADPRRAWGEGGLERALDRLVAEIVARRRTVLVAAGAVVAIAAAGMHRLEVETDFTKNFRADSPIVEAYEMVETRLGGAGVLDVLLPIGGAVDAATLARVASLEKSLRDLPGVDGPAFSKVMSVADVFDAVSPVPIESLARSALGGITTAAAIAAMESGLPQVTSSLVGRDPEDGSRWLRIMLRAKERQPTESKRRIIDETRRLAAGVFPPAANGREPGVTGFFVLLSQLVERMLADQWLTFAIATAGIFLALAIGFRSLVLAGVALVPNIVPIFVVLGVLGWIGTPVNMGTAMIAAVSMGLSIDSSIHYIAAFRRRQRGGDAVHEALAGAHQTAGRAMIFSTLALVVGFLALVTSGFIPTVSFGALSAVTLAGGLLGNLVVLPVLLAIVARPS
jgi:predicted RND superfamily exporter protein